MGPLEVILFHSPAQAGPPIAGNNVQTDFECLQEDSSTSLDNLCQCSVTHTIKQHFHTCRQYLLPFTSCPLALVLSLDTTAKSLAPVTLHPPPSCICAHWLDRPELSLLQAKTVPDFSSFPRRRGVSVSLSFSWTFAGLSPVVSCLPCTWEPRTGRSTAGVASPLLSRGEEGTPPSVSWQLSSYCSPGYH